MTSTVEHVNGIEIREISIYAIVQGEWFIPIDSAGNRIGKNIPRESVGGQLQTSVARDWTWAIAIKRMNTRLIKKCSNKQDSSWNVRIASLASSLRLRRRFQRTMHHSRQRFEHYSTSTWEEAAPRLWQQAHTRQKKALLTGWGRWAATVSKNHNRKGY